MRILRTDDVLDILSIGRTTLHRWRKSGDFPEPKQLGPHAVGWTEEQLERWLDSRPSAETATGAADG